MPLSALHEVSDTRGRSVLWHAAQNGHLDVCQWMRATLVNEGQAAQWNELVTRPDSELGITPRSAAQQGSHRAVVVWLQEQEDAARYGL